MSALMRWSIVGVLTLVALALRWPSPDQQIEYDEVISLYFARLEFTQMIRATAADTMPPLYYTLLHYWRALGDDLFIARLLSALLGSVSIPLTYLLGRRLVGEMAAFAGASLIAISPFHIFYGHYARMYTLLLVLGLLATLFFLNWLRQSDKADGGAGKLRPRLSLLFFSIVMTVAFYTHNLAFLLPATLDILFVLTRGPAVGLRRTKAMELVVSHVVMGIALLPSLAYLPGQLEKVTRAFWIDRPGAAELVRTAIIYHFHLPLPPEWLPIAAFVSLLFIAFTVTEIRRIWLRTPELRFSLLTLGVLAFAPPILMFLVSQVRPIYVERAILLSSGAYYLLMAGALQAMRIREIATAVALVMLLGVGAANDYQFAYNSFPRSLFSEASAYLAEGARPDDLVLHDNKLSFFPMHFLAPRMRQAYLGDPPESRNDTLAFGSQEALGLFPVTLPEGTRGFRRVWLIFFDGAEAQSTALGQPLASKQWLQARFAGGLEARIGDLNIYLYHRDAP